MGAELGANGSALFKKHIALMAGCYLYPQWYDNGQYSRSEICSALEALLG